MPRPRFLTMALPAAILALGIAAASADEPVTRDKVMAALPGLDELASRIIRDDGVPGLSIAVVYQDEVVYLKGFGVRETGKPEPVDGDTVFQIASMSKPISATVADDLRGELIQAGERCDDLVAGHRLVGRSGCGANGEDGSLEGHRKD